MKFCERRQVSVFAVKYPPFCLDISQRVEILDEKYESLRKNERELEEWVRK